MIEELHIQTPGRGLYEITAEVSAVVSQSAITEGLCTVFVRHTSASLLIQENADPSARSDLEAWMDRFVPDGTGWAHTHEGPDDMPSHIRSAITATSLSIPVDAGRLVLGTWQGIYIWEH
ncbi:MAG TPA: YjbQ family protein, partial [Phycisphaerales bacterium]|nr:YjbQ family protein [Phycisphaerales bacterium]